MEQQASGAPEAQEARAPNEIPVAVKSVELVHSPMSLRVRSVHFCNEPGMQVALAASTTFADFTVYMTTAETRQLAAALVACANHFDAEAAKAGVQ